MTFPLSEGQKGLWLLQELSPEMSAYNVPMAIHIRAAVDGDALKKSGAFLLEKHPLLRAVISRDKEGALQQTIRNDAEFYFQHERLAEETSDHEVTALLQVTCRKPFRLEEGPLMRWHLFSRSEEDHVLLINLHHIIFDGVSSLLLMEDLFFAWQNYIHGKTPVMPPAGEASYFDFVTWEEKMLSGKEGEEHLDYWRKKLSGSLPVLEFPPDKARPPHETSAGETCRFKWSENLTNRLRSLAKKEGVSLFMVLSGLYKVLLYRYTNQEDIIVGTPAAGRPEKRFERIVGYFINMIPLRSQLVGSESFKTCLEGLKRTIIQGLEHSVYPLPKIVSALNGNQGFSQAPLFQTSFVMQNFFAATMQKELEKQVGVMEILPEIHQEREGDLNVEVVEEENELRVHVTYNPDLFHETTMIRFMNRYSLLAEQIVDDPERKLDDYNLLSETERHQLLVEWNDTEAGYPADRCIHQLFEEQAEKTPDAVALTFDDQSLTYDRLNQKSERWASVLQGAGVRPNSLVGLCVERSLDLLPALLGILKAGGAYVPLEPEYPEDRLSYMLKDSGVERLLTQKKHVEKLRALSGETVRIYCLDQEQAVGEKPLQSRRVLPRNVRPRHPAYILYTSGSTGKPKGVMVGHQALCNRIWWMQKMYRLSEKDKIFQKTPFSFDVSGWEFYWPLIAGSELVVAQPQKHKDPVYLIETIQRKGITVLHFVPPMLQAFLHTDGVEKCESVTRVFCSGEALTTAQKDLFFKRWNRPELHNLYGPTEAAIDVSFYQCSKEPRATIPIGRPLSNIQLYILDKRRRLLPIGIGGELHIAGDGLAEGYWNQPELTAETFIENPFISRARMYRTGDWARWLPDGTIEFLGRIDHQVKIRGFRIEPGEIENRLSRHPFIQRSVVIVKEENDKKQLVAYYVAQDKASSSLESSSLSEYVGKSLPDYMIPTAFVCLDEIPLTSNGKVDRKKLVMQEVNIKSSRSYVAPRNETEQKLAKIWQTVLGVEEVGLYDDFFELGGDSIISIQVAAKARQEGLDVTVRNLLECKTIEALAREGSPDRRMVAEQEFLEGKAPLLPAQHWFFEESFRGSHHWNQSLLLTLKRLVKLDLLRTAFKLLIGHHDALRFRYHGRKGCWEQNYGGMPDEIPVIHCDLQGMSDAKRVEALENHCQQAQTSLNMEEGPILRAILFETGPEEQSLFITIHHLAVDGVSWRILLEDLQSVMGQLLTGQPVQLPPKTTSCRYWGEKLTAYSKAEDLQGEKVYWTKRPWSKSRGFPVDFDVDKNVDVESTTAHVRVCLTREQTRQLLEESGKAYNTQINDLLLTALITACHAWTGREWTAITLEGHGREELFDDVDLSRTVGWFTTVFPVLLSKRNTLEETLKGVKETLRAVPRHGAGYGLLKYLAGDREIEALPKPELIFNYLGRWDEPESSERLFGERQDVNAPEHSLKAHRSAMIEVNGMIHGRILSMTFSYSRKRYKRATMETFSESYREALCQIIEHCSYSEVKGYTPSDFPLISIPQKELDLLVQSGPEMEDLYPATQIQTMMVEQYQAGPSPVYHSQQVYLMEIEDFSPACFDQALCAVMDANPGLRSCFIRSASHRLLQWVRARGAIEMASEDLSSLDRPRQKKWIDRRLVKDRVRGFDPFDREHSLWRVIIFRLSKTEMALGISSHHAIMDGWSNMLFLRQVFEHYETLKNHRPITSRISVNVCKAFVVQEQRLLEDERQKAFWMEKARQAPCVQPDRKKSGAATADREEMIYRIEEKTGVALVEAAQKRRVSLKAVLLAGYLQALKTSDQDVTVGVVTNGRTEELPGALHAIGQFWNITPFYYDFKQKPGSPEDGSAIHNQLNEIDARYGRYPLPEILKIGERDDLFFATFNYIHFHEMKTDDTVSGDMGRITVYETCDHYHYPFNCTVSRNSDDDSLTLHINFDADLICLNDVEEIMSQYIDALRKAVE